MTHPIRPVQTMISRRLALAAGLATTLAACALPLPEKPIRGEPWDLGPLLELRNEQPLSNVTIALVPIQAPSSIDSTAIMYRLLYAGTDQQPRPYAYARWSMAPPQLFEQRLRAALATAYPVVDSASGLEQILLQIDLETFAQFFSTPEDSEGVVRLRTIALAPAGPKRLLGQRVFVARSPARTPDAAGGVRALREASDEIIGKLAGWVNQLAQELPAPQAPGS